MTDLITKARALLAAATDGPWRRAYHRSYEVEAPPNQLVADCGTMDGACHDAALIAAAPTLLAALADEVERVRPLLKAHYNAAEHADAERFKAEAERDEARAERDRLARGQDEALADLESAWAKAGEMLGTDAGMEAYTAADAMRGIIEAARNEGEDERDAMCAVVEAAREWIQHLTVDRNGRFSDGVPGDLMDALDALAALDAATGEEASDV